MILRSFRVENFKCFRDSGDIVLDTGFNIFVGKNNSGKSTFIQALKYLDFNKPHKSSTIPADEPLDPNSSIKLNLSFGSQEFSKFVRSRVNEFSMRDNGANDHNQFLHEVLHQGEFVTLT